MPVAAKNWWIRDKVMGDPATGAARIRAVAAGQHEGG